MKQLPKCKSLKPRTEKDQMISSQIWKTERVARQINSFTGLPVDELVSVARSFLPKIWETFDNSKGANFSTWVNRCLFYHLLNYLRDNSRMVKMPRSFSEIYLKIRKEQKKSPQISVKELSSVLKVHEETIYEVLQAFNSKCIPIDIKDNETTENTRLDNIEFAIYQQSVKYEDTGETDSYLADIEKYIGVIQSLSDEEFNLLDDSLIKGRSNSYLRKKYNKLIKKEESVQKFISKIRNLCQNQ